METLPEMPVETDVADQTRRPEMAIIGLGRMGGGMIRRLIRSGHTIVGYNRSPDKTHEVALEGAVPAFSLKELVDVLPKPRAVWLMLPAGAATQAQIVEHHAWTDSSDGHDGGR